MTRPAAAVAVHRATALNLHLMPLGASQAAMPHCTSPSSPQAATLMRLVQGALLPTALRSAFSLASGRSGRPTARCTQGTTRVQRCPPVQPRGGAAGLVPAFATACCSAVSAVCSFWHSSDGGSRDADRRVDGSVLLRAMRVDAPPWTAPATHQGSRCVAELLCSVQQAARTQTRSVLGAVF